MFKSCPECGSPSFNGEEACKCGYDYNSTAAKAKQEDIETDESQSSAMFNWAVVLSILGLVLLMIAAFGYEVTATPSYLESDVINIGRLQMQLMIYQTGLVSILAGVICFAAHSLSNR